MNNYEYYQKEIIEILETGENVGVAHNKPADCEGLSCFACDLHNLKASCKSNLAKWLKEEYKPQEIDWNKVPMFTKVWVRDDVQDDWHPRHFIGMDTVLQGNFLVTTRSEFSYEGQEYATWNYCKLDDSVDPTPYLKEA